MNWKTFLIRTDGIDGCDLHRAVLPARWCSDELLRSGIQLRLATDILHSEKPSAILVHRILKHEAIVALCRFKALGTKICWDTDDACDLVPAWSPVQYTSRHLDCYLALQGCADEKWTSTQSLADHIQAQRVLPNLMDPSWFVRLPEKPKDRPVQILWFGSVTHQGDLDDIIPDLAQVLDKIGNRVRITFWGDAPGALLQPYLGKNVQVLRAVPLANFLEQLIRLAPDIILCPLADHPFNSMKSNLKWMEAAVSGGCPFVSDSLAFRCVEDGVTGVIVRPGEWAGKLLKFIQDKEGREIIARQCRECVREEWCWDGPQRELWLEAFTEMI